jgi:hypothetical protein
MKNTVRLKHKAIRDDGTPESDPSRYGALRWHCATVEVLARIVTAVDCGACPASFSPVLSFSGPFSRVSGMRLGANTQGKEGGGKSKCNTSPCTKQ